MKPSPVYALLLAAGLMSACGTRKNPALCCTDQANCTSLGIPDTQICTDGLVCRGNQCIAEVCSTPNDCDAAVPFCSTTGLCAATCEDSSQCPGFGGDAADAFCSKGACVQCLGSSNCATTAPVCDTGVCRGCALDGECQSDVCGDDGTCLSQSDVVYVDAAGSDAGPCTKDTPCRTLGFASKQAGGVRSTISVAPGSYNEQFRIASDTTSASQLDIHGHGAAFFGRKIDGAAFELGVSSRLRDLHFDGGDGNGNLLLQSGASYELDNIELGCGSFPAGSSAALSIT